MGAARKMPLDDLLLLPTELARRVPRKKLFGLLMRVRVDVYLFRHREP
jgi:hypothetical protein